MKVGQEVSYITADNERDVVEVAAIVGEGPSLNKRLDLRWKEGGEEQEAKDVPHEVDAEEGEGFWLIKGERRTRSPKDSPVTAKKVEEVKPDLTAFPDPPGEDAPARGPRRGVKR